MFLQSIIYSSFKYCTLLYNLKKISTMELPWDLADQIWLAGLEFGMCDLALFFGIM